MAKVTSMLARPYLDSRLSIMIKKYLSELALLSCSRLVETNE
jgi:hypothetical protein